MRTFIFKYRHQGGDLSPVGFDAHYPAGHPRELKGDPETRIAYVLMHCTAAHLAKQTRKFLKDYPDMVALMIRLNRAD